MSLLHVFLGLPLWIPGQSLPGGVAGRLPGGMANPTPPSSADLWGHWVMTCCLPQILIAYLLWSPDTEDVSC